MEVGGQISYTLSGEGKGGEADQCVCVSVREREREVDRDRETQIRRQRQGGRAHKATPGGSSAIPAMEVGGHRGTSLRKNSTSSGPYSRAMPRYLWWS